MTLTQIPMEKSQNYYRTIDSFSRECKQTFRFEQIHLKLLCELLKFPSTIIFCNGMKMSGEEVFLRGLYELRNGEYHLDIVKVCLTQ